MRKGCFPVPVRETSRTDKAKHGITTAVPTAREIAHRHERPTFTAAASWVGGINYQVLADLAQMVRSSLHVGVARLATCQALDVRWMLRVCRVLLFTA